MSDIQTLMEVTGLDRAAAQRVLTVSNNNLERAINFHLEGNTIEPPIVVGDGDVEGAAADVAGAPPPLTNGAPSMPHLDVGGGDELGEDGVRAPIPVRREQMLQPEEDNFRMRVRRPFATAFGAHNVCPLRNFQLEGELQEAQLSDAYMAAADGVQPTVGPTHSQHATMTDSVIPAARSAGLSRSGAMVVAARVASDAASVRRAKRSRLGDLFRPPVDLSVVGSLQMVKDCAKTQNRWVIVNLQDNVEFTSQVMNRDVWSDGKLRELIGKYFVFWQIAVDTSEGARFQSFYGARQLPYVCLIDPQTGEEKTNYKSETDAPTGGSQEAARSSRSGPTVSAPFRLSAAEFVADLRTFLRTQGVSPDPSAPSNIDQAAVAADKLSATATPPTAEPVSLSEDEQLRLAIENSLRESQVGGAGVEDGTNAGASTSRSTSSSPGGPTPKMAKYIVDSDDDDSCDESAAVPPPPRATAARSANDGAPPFRPVDLPSQYARYLGPSSDPLTKLQLRLPDGRRENLEWPCSSHIRALRLYVEHAYPEVTRLPYKLICPYPRKDLLELDASETLLGAKLHPSVLLHVHQDD